jgi:hypothetical protein
VPTFRDDLARVGRKLLETVEDRTGREVVKRDDLQLLESDRSELRRARQTLDFIGFSLWNYNPVVPGGPHYFDLMPQVRRMAAQQSLRAWVEDPQAGHQVDLYVSFIFGRGIPRPVAHDPEVQKQLDKTWDDAANKRVLTSYEKLVEKGVDLCITANVFFTIFDDGLDGIARMSTLRFQNVEDVVRHPDDENRILYYKVLERKAVWDYTKGAYVTPPAESGEPLGPKTVYHEAYEAFDDDNPVMAAQDVAVDRPPDNVLAPGKVVHLAVNKTSEMAFGVPRMRRQMRWFAAYNETLEGHVNRMKAMASVYMKATAKGSQRDLDRLAQMATNRSSAFGTTQEVEPGRPVAPVGPGILGENESLNYDPFKIDSGASDMQASAPILRGQINGPWPDHYMGGAVARLAGATALELPILKFVEREQEMWLMPLRALGHCSVEAAVREGDISEWRDPTARELEQIQAAELENEPVPVEMNDQGQIKRDLDFDIALPSPLKRVMADLVKAAVDTATAVDPNGTSPEMSRWLFGFILSEAFDVEDPQRIVDQIFPRQAPKPEPVVPIDPQTGLPVVDPNAPPAAQPGAVGPDGQRHQQDNPYGAPRNSPTPEELAKQKLKETPELADVLDAHDEAVRSLVPMTGLGLNGDGA